MKKIIRTGDDARRSLQRGLNFAADCVKKTLGPSGRNTLIGRAYLSPEITNDGKTTLESIYLDDEIEQLAVEVLKDNAKQMFEESEDGTSTATTLTQAIFNFGMEKLVDNPVTGYKADPMKLRNEIKAAAQEICDKLDTMAVPISKIEEIKQVAFVSVENEEIAQIIADVFFKIGKDSLVEVEEGFAHVESEITEGMEIEAGLFSDKMANNGNKYILENPKILVTNQPLSTIGQITEITKALSTDKMFSLVILGDNFSKEFLQEVLAAHIFHGFTIIPVKTPFFGKSEQLEDIAVAVGATFYDKDGKSVSDCRVTELGTVAKITVSKNKTVLIGAAGDTTKRAAEISMEMHEVTNPFDKKQFEKRLARLMGKVGIIRVGADSSKERTYLMKKVRNAVGATRNALKEGVVIGAGLAFVEISGLLPDNILASCIQEPFLAIESNAGGTIKVDGNIVDPVITEKTALKLAASVAGLFLTVDTVSADKYVEPTDAKGE